MVYLKRRTDKEPKHSVIYNAVNADGTAADGTALITTVYVNKAGLMTLNGGTVNWPDYLTLDFKPWSGPQVSVRSAPATSLRKRA